MIRVNKQYCDVDSSLPGGEKAPKGPAVRRVKWYVSWVQNVKITAFINGNIDLVSAYIGETLISWTG